MFDADTVEKLITNNIKKHAVNGFQNMTEEEFTKIMTNVIYSSFEKFKEYTAKEYGLKLRG